MKLTVVGVLICAIFLGVSCGGKKNLPTAQKTEKPTWVDQRPGSSLYYIGIGRSSKSGSPNDFAEIAKRNALQDLASEIEVKIDANSLMYQFEDNDEFREDFMSSARLKTNLELEGYERVGDWSDESNYYTYYRLDKAIYAQIQRDKKLKALDRSQTFLMSAEQAIDQKNYPTALSNLINALVSIEAYLNESLEIEEEGEVYHYDNRLYSLLQSTLNEINLQKLNPIVETAPGMSLDESKIRVLAVDQNDRPIEDLPILFESDWIEKNASIKTSQNGEVGMAMPEIDRIGRSTVKAKIDLMDFLKKDDSLARALLTTLDVPSEEISVISESPRVYIETNLTHSGNPWNASQLVSELRTSLISNSFQNEIDRRKAHYILKVDCESNESGEYQGLFTTSLTGSVTLVSNANDEAVYSESVSGLKGVGLTYLDGAKKGFDSLIKELNVGIVPRMKRKLIKK